MQGGKKINYEGEGGGAKGKYAHRAIRRVGDGKKGKYGGNGLKGIIYFRGLKGIRSGECMGKEGTHYKRAFLRGR